MKRVEGNADRQKDVEMRRMVDDADARERAIGNFPAGSFRI